MRQGGGPCGMLLALAVLVGACAVRPPAAAVPDPAHNARNALDWAGIYRGVLPCADCPGIDTIVVLRKDGTYRMERVYLEREGSWTEAGDFSWAADGNRITLSGGERLFVSENRLIQLASDGTRITGDLAPHNELIRQPERIAGVEWRLVELRGKKLARDAARPTVGVLLDPESGQTRGFGGCNHFTGSYRLDESRQRIAFEQLASTLRACGPEATALEQAIHDVLLAVDGYALEGDRLALHRARMAPAARFEAAVLH